LFVQLLGELNDEETHIAVLCERAFLAALDGSCRTPIAGHALKEPDTGKLKFSGLIATTDGKEVKRGQGESDFTREAATELGTKIGTDLKAQCGPAFFDWEEAQKGLRAPVQETAASSA
jgi:hydroxymethylbilane synthase